MITYINAIKAINPDAQFTYSGKEGSTDTLDTIQWLDNTTPISKSDIENKYQQLKTEYDNNKYQRDRAKEYPTWQDQLDDIYHNGIDAWKATIKVTKDKYSKP